MKSERTERREFLKKAGKVAATAPAVAMLLSSSAMPAKARGRYGRNGGPPDYDGHNRGHNNPGRNEGHGGGHGGH